MYKRLPILLALLIVSALSLAACGGGGGDEGEIEEVVETSATTTDPADCKGLQTQEFMEQISRESGVAAVESCEEEAKNEEGADAVEVSAIKVDGSDATAEAALEGGALDGQTVEVALAKDGDQWKMNEVVKFTNFDHAHLMEGLEKQLIGASGEEAKFAGCFVDVFKQASEAEVEELIFGKSPQALEEVFEACSSRPGA